MKRRIILVVTTLAALLVAFYVYSLVAGLDITRVIEPDLPGRTRRTRQVSGPGGTSIEDADDISIIARDKYGRLEAIYRARKWKRRDDGSHLLIGPRVELYHRNDQRTILRADRAEVYGEELDRGVNVRRAKLSGNVTIYFDPSTEPDRSPVEQRLDEVVRIHVDHVEFDNERLTIETDSRVTVFSPQADIYGRGLSVSWNESPRELRLLRIDQGQYMAVYNVPEKLEMISLPGGREEGPATTQPATKPAGAGAAPAATQPATRPATRPGAARAELVVVEFGDDGPRTTTQPTTATAPASPKARNQYVAEFNRDVKVVHRDRKLHGAETLKLGFDWDASWRKDSGGYLGGRRAKKRRQAASRPAGPIAATAPTTAATTQPASAPAQTQPAEPEPMEVYWTGPLVIRPVGRTETPTRDRYEVTASGPRVVLTDPRATALCREFLFRHPEQAGYLVGLLEHPVRLLLAEGADVVSRKIRFDPGQGKAYLDGAGYMARRFGKGLSQAKALELVETEEPKIPPASERVTWDGNVELAFTREEVKRRDGSIETRQFIREAEFRKNVVLQESEDPNGDYVRCNELKVHMARGRRVAAFPGKAIATGEVFARQEGSDVRARKITVHFGEVDPPDANGATDVASAIRPEFVIAEGDVRMTDRREPDSPPLEALADHVISDLVKRTAMLTGSPARIAQGPNHLTGNVVRLDQRQAAADVDGKGALHFLTRKDLNGRTLSKPQPVAVGWSKSMRFRGEQRTASFAGDVSLDGGMDHVGCQSMQLLFTDPPAPKKPASTQPATQPATRPARSRRLGGMAVGLERYSRQRISMVLADKDVTLQSRRENAGKQLVRRIQLTGDKLIYDAQTSRLTMLGYGTFMAEDYQKPKEQRQAGPDGLVAAVGRPSQTAFQWNDSMQFSQQDRLVVLDGNVKMVHRSGDKVVLTDNLNVPRDVWGKLEVGRRTVLTCGNMMAKFAEPEKSPRTRPAAGDLSEEGPDLGPLQLFSATRDVNLKDGPWQVLAQRLIYNREKDLAVIWGFVEGERPANATVLYEDPTTGRSQSWSSPRIIWYRQNNKIVTEEVTGAGGR